MKELFKTLNLAAGQRDKFALLYELVRSAPLNVTAIKEERDFFLKHIFDSLYIFQLSPMEFNTLADIGSGGGFPGIPIALLYPERKITLVESILKKCRFLEDCALKLTLSNLEVVNLRAEAVTGSFDLITARGAGSVKEILKATLHLSQKNTVWLLYKGERAEAELAEADSILRKRGIKSEIIRIEEPIKRSYLFLRYI
jgi:16S rRNA (guanine527-N7)-methyltransferase